MPISTTDLVEKLVRQFNQFVKLSADVVTELKGSDVRFSVSLSYSTLTFSIHSSGDLYFHCSGQQGGLSGVARSEYYCRNERSGELLKKQVEALAMGRVVDELANTCCGEEIQRHLRIAESIASTAYVCTSGDDYRPGFFSEMIIQNDGIVLRQINHMNSRSLDHKKDYSLRELEIFIPLQQSTVPVVEKMNEQYIGMMRIHFSDRSSQNNKQCGDRIRQKIDEEKKKLSSLHLKMCLV